MTGFNIVEPRVDFIDPRTGKISREWYLFLQGLYFRAGGANGQSTEDLAISMPDDAGVEEIKADSYQLRDELTSIPDQPQVVPDQLDLDRPPEQLQEIPWEYTELSALREEIADLREAVFALQQGIIL